MPTELPRRHLSDPRALRAMAHPLRLRLIEELAVHGAQTATQLADRVAESPSNCSWHLRQLAKFGFVEEAAVGRGRQRPWQTVVENLSWGDPGDLDGPEERTAGAALSETLMERQLAALQDYHRREHAEPPAWREAAFTTSSLAWMTAEELRELGEAIAAIVTRHPERFDDPAARPEGARPVRIAGWGVPFAPPPSDTP